MINVVLISPEDNVGVVIEWIKKGEEIEFKTNEGEVVNFTSLDDIRIYHKIAIRDIKQGEHIVKYGEHIGIASSNIAQGEHVHTHNVEDNREDLLKAE